MHPSTTPVLVACLTSPLPHREGCDTKVSLTPSEHTTTQSPCSNNKPYTQPNNHTPADLRPLSLSRRPPDPTAAGKQKRTQPAAATLPPPRLPLSPRHPLWHRAPLPRPAKHRQHTAPPPKEHKHTCRFEAFEEALIIFKGIPLAPQPQHTPRVSSRRRRSSATARGERDVEGCRVVLC